MSKVPLKNTAVIQRLLTERRQFESWITRLDSAADATPEAVRSKVRADYEARLQAVIEELKSHAETARQVMGQQHELQKEMEQREARAAEKLVEIELRHAVGELDEAEWTKVHKDALAELVTIRQELKSVQEDIAQLEELDALARGRPGTSPSPAARSAGGGGSSAKAGEDELSFLKSVTEEVQERPQSTIRRSTGAQFQPATPSAPAPSPRRTGPAPVTPL
ncbi:MAG: hypothetical protein ACREMV_00910, partial [Gemmatimonadales bacterium]